MVGGTTFEVQLGESFAGPIEKLLELIKKRRLPINEVSLIQITDDYINYINSLRSIPDINLSEFLVIASTLVLIKSNSLLPGLREDFNDEEDSAELERRIQLFAIYQKAGLNLTKHFDGVYSLIPIKYPSVRTVVFSPGRLTAMDLHKAITDVFATLPQQEPQPEDVNVDKIVDLNDVINDIKSNLNQKEGHKFSPSNFNNKQELIVNFLAILEIVRSGIADIEKIDKNEVLLKGNGGV